MFKIINMYICSCPCDECTITHMITCGIINPDVLENATSSASPVNTHNGNFLHDPNRYRIDVSPPSMSSTTSSSGSSSPIFVDPDRLRTSLKDGNRYMYFTFCNIYGVLIMSHPVYWGDILFL